MLSISFQVVISLQGGEIVYFELDMNNIEIKYFGYFEEIEVNKRLLIFRDHNIDVRSNSGWNCWKSLDRIYMGTSTGLFPSVARHCPVAAEAVGWHR